ncbi:hypothetical protein JCM3770_004671 [Rhodotorula araucariae]
MVVPPRSPRPAPAFPPFALADGRLRIPSHLPRTPSFPPVILDQLDLDDDLVESGAPLEFALAALQRIALQPTQLLQAEASTTELDEPAGTDTSPFPRVRCRRPLPTSTVPTHVLELTFADTPWPLLHRYVYDGSAAQLLNSLLGAPATPSAQPRPAALPNDGATGGGAQRPLATGEHQGQLDSLLIRLMRVREVWLNAARLEMSDRTLWETLARAWGILMAELGEVAALVPGSSVPPALVPDGAT